MLNKSRRFKKIHHKLSVGKLMMESPNYGEFVASFSDSTIYGITVKSLLLLFTSANFLKT